MPAQGMFGGAFDYQAVNVSSDKSLGLTTALSFAGGEDGDLLLGDPPEGSAPHPPGSEMDDDSSFDDVDGRQGVWRGLAVCGCAFCVALVLLASVLLLSLDTIAKRALNDVGTETMGVQTSIGGSHISVTAAKTQLTDLVAPTPPGFVTESPFVTVGSLDCDMDLWSLLAKPTKIEEIALRDIHVSVSVIAQSGSTNAEVILDHMDAKDSSDAGYFARLFIADRLSFSNLSVSVSIHPLTDIAGKLPPVVLNNVLVTDVGKKRGGVHLDEMMKIVMHVIMRACLQAVPGQFSKSLQSRLSQVLDFDLVDFDYAKGFESAVTNSTLEVNAALNNIMTNTSVGRSVSAMMRKTGRDINGVLNGSRLVGDAANNFVNNTAAVSATLDKAVQTAIETTVGKKESKAMERSAKKAGDVIGKTVNNTMNAVSKEVSKNVDAAATEAATALANATADADKAATQAAAGVNGVLGDLLGGATTEAPVITVGSGDAK